MLLVGSLPVGPSQASSSGACTTAACVVSISYGIWCDAADDGSDWGFIHPLGSASVRGNLPSPFTYFVEMGDDLTLRRLTNWPGPVSESWTAQDSPQGWLVYTPGHKYTYHVRATIFVWQSSLIGSNSETRETTVTCT